MEGYIDPDVGGPGVIFGFIFTGFLAFVFSCMAFGLREHQVSSNRSTPQSRTLSSVDKLLKYLTPATVDNPTFFWITILERFIIMLSDQQLITGMLLLILSYIKYYGDDFISLLVAIDLVFFSTVTHAATLLVLRSYLRQHPKMTTCRIFIAITTFALWAAGVIITFARIFRTQKLEELLSSQYSSINIFSIVSEMLALIGLFWIYVDLSLGLWLSDTAIEARASMNDVRNKDLSKVQVWIDDCEKRDVLTAGEAYGRVMLPVRHFIKRFCIYYISIGPSWTRVGLWLIAEILFPWYLSMYLLGLLFVLGVINLVLDLYQSGLSNSWGFGQLLPTFLIFLPIFTFFETYGDEPRSQRHVDVPSTLRQNAIALVAVSENLLNTNKLRMREHTNLATVALPPLQIEEDQDGPSGNKPTEGVGQQWVGTLR